MSKISQDSGPEVPKIQELSGDSLATHKKVGENNGTQKNPNQNQTSTPLLGQKAASFFEPDISRISGLQPSTSLGQGMCKAASVASLYDITRQVGSRGKSTPSAAAKKKKPKSGVDRQMEIENLKSRYVQLYGLCQLQEKQNKKENSELEEILEQYRKKIEEDRRVLEETRRQIQQIKINCEIENIHRLHTAVFQQVTDKLEASNCDASLKATCDLLEHYKDKVPIKDIEVPEDGLEQVKKSMKNVIESVKNLSSKHNFEAYGHLGKVNVSLKDCEEVAKRCTEKLEDLKLLKLQEASLKISYGEEDEEKETDEEKKKDEEKEKEKEEEEVSCSPEN